MDLKSSDGHHPECPGGGLGYVRVGKCACGVVLRPCSNCKRVCSDGESWGFGLCSCGNFRSQAEGVDPVIPAVSADGDNDG